MSQPLIHISRKQAFLFAGFLVLYEFLTYIANDMIMPGMLHVVQAFHSDESAVATSLTAYVLGGASLQIFLGPLSDRFGRRPVMLTGAILFALLTLLIAASQSIEQFLVARFLRGWAYVSLRSSVTQPYKKYLMKWMLYVWLPYSPMSPI